MKKSRRLIRNTILTLGGVMVLYVGVNRLYAVDESAKPFQGTSAAELALLRDFSVIEASGDLSVEVVQQADYSVTYTPAGEPQRLVAIKRDNTLVLHAVSRLPPTHVKVGMPSLAMLVAHETPALTISGFDGATLSLRLTGKPQVKLQNNSVRLWRVFASDSSELIFDKASLDAGKLDLAGRATVTVVE